MTQARKWSSEVRRVKLGSALSKVGAIKNANVDNRCGHTEPVLH